MGVNVPMNDHVEVWFFFFFFLLFDQGKLFFLTRESILVTGVCMLSNHRIPNIFCIGFPSAKTGTY